MKITLIEAPYDSGHYGERLGRGPLHFVEGGLAERLESEGHESRIERIRLPEGFLTEVGCATALQREIRRRVIAAIGDGSWPVILSGNCTPAALGAATAFAPGTTGVLWFDAHGDFNTPDTSPSGFFDGMGLSVLTGESWRGLAASMESFHPTSEEDVLLIGARDLDEAERDRIRRSTVRWLPVDALRGSPAALGAALAPIAARVEHFYLHLDLDVLDPATLRANAYAAEGGLTLEELEACIHQISATLPICAAALTAYDPTADEAGRGIHVAARLIAAAASGAKREDET